MTSAKTNTSLLGLNISEYYHPLQTHATLIKENPARLPETSSNFLCRMPRRAGGYYERLPFFISC